MTTQVDHRWRWLATSMDVMNFGLTVLTASASGDRGSVNHKTRCGAWTDIRLKSRGKRGVHVIIIVMDGWLEWLEWRVAVMHVMGALAAG